MTLSIALLAFSALCIYACYSVAKRKKANVLFWVTMGLLFGPLAVPFVFFAKTRNE
jgi:drug/metabolite transporter (DMT)-like permease